MSDASPVVVFSLWPRVLVFHQQEPWNARPHPVELADGWKRNESRTICGELTYAIEWRDIVPTPARPPWSDTRGEVNRGTFLRRDHAEKIGRPCSRCFA